MQQLNKGIKLAGVTSDPVNPEDGMIIYRSDLNNFRKYENGVWSNISGDQLPILSAGQIIVGDSSGIPTAASLSGDASLSDTGALTLNTVSIDKGGTGATNVADAITNLLGPHSLGTNGYVQIGTVIIQWGSSSLSPSTSGTTGSFSFPTVFPNFCASIQTTPNFNVTGTSVFNVISKTTSGFTIQRSNNSNLDTGTTFFWMAIGY